MKRLLLKAAIFLAVSLLFAYAIYWSNITYFRPESGLKIDYRHMSFVDAFFVEIMVLLLLGSLLIFTPPYRPRPDFSSCDVIMRMEGEFAPWEDSGPEKRDRQIGAVLTLTGLFLLVMYVLHDPSCLSGLLEGLGITTI